MKNKKSLYGWSVAVFLAVTTLHLVCHGLEHPEWAAWTKPLLMPSLALVTFARLRLAGLSSEPRAKAVIAALLCGAAGDIFLMSGGEAMFIAGLLAFLAGHVSYFLSMPYSVLRKPLSSPTDFIFLFAFLILGGVVFTVLKGMSPGNWLLVGLYAMVFPFMAGLSLFCVKSSKKYWLTALGYLLFAFSDSLVAMACFTGEHVPLHGLIVMSTYILAQALISKSLTDALAETRGLHGGSDS